MDIVSCFFVLLAGESVLAGTGDGAGIYSVLPLFGALLADTCVVRRILQTGEASCPAFFVNSDYICRCGSLAGNNYYRV